MKHYLCLIIMLIILLGCSAPIKQGAEFNDHYVGKIIKRGTTKQQLIEWFGEPAIKQQYLKMKKMGVFVYKRQSDRRHSKNKIGHHYENARSLFKRRCGN